MRTINVKVLRDCESDNLRLKEGQIIEIEFHISGYPTYNGIELDNIWDDEEFDDLFGEVE